MRRQILVVSQARDCTSCSWTRSDTTARPTGDVTLRRLSILIFFGYGCRWCSDREVITDEFVWDCSCRAADRSRRDDAPPYERDSSTDHARAVRSDAAV